MKDSRKEYYQKNKEEIRRRSREYYWKNKEEIYKRRRSYYLKRYENDKDRILGLMGELYEKRRTEVIKFFGGKCVACGNNDIRVLQIDHINGGGVKERKEQTKLGYSYKKRFDLNKENKDQYQLLCANCNWIKRYEQKEYRQRR